MYKHRAKRFPRLPEHRHDLVIPDQFKTTKSGEDFLLCQSISRHILVFATGSNIRLLAARRTWGMDGTFKIVPQWYQQLFTIHAFVAGKLVPAVYCLCTGKDIGTYGYIFQALIDKAAVLEVDLNPDTIICDFETALIPAIRGYFPNTRVQGCYFHFCQAVHRKVGELGLKTRYRQHEETKRKIRMLLATAFLPVPHKEEDVNEGSEGRKKSEDLDMIFPVEQLQPKENLQHLASLTPLAVWSKVFTDEMIDHITFQSNLYAHRECNNRAFTVTQHEIQQFIGLILLPGYNCFPEARHYWCTQPDTGSLAAISSMSRNRFMEIKNLIQHGMFHEKLSVDESIVPYFGRHGAKMFVKGKPIRYQLLVKLAGLKMRAIGTIRPYRSNGADAVMLPDNELRKQNRGAYDFRSDGNVYIVKWNDNAIVKIASNFMTHSPLRSTQRRVKGQRIEVPMPNIVRSYNIGMGGVDLLDRLAAAYRPSIRGKKWYWPLFVNAVNVATVAAWRLHCFVEERPLSHLEFRRQVVLSLLQSERAAPPRVASGSMSQLPDIRFDGANHILGTGPQGRCKVCKRNTKNMCRKCNVRLHAERGKHLLEAGTTGTLAALFQYFQQEWMTDERLPLWNVHSVNIRTNNHLEGWHNRLNRKAGKSHNGLYELLQLLIAEQGVMDTLIQQVLSGNATVGDLRRVNRVYAEKQQRVAQYTGEYTNGRRTLEQFLAALMHLTPEPI
ncbi:PiggyBac transposable element-derived protein 3 [Trichinella zimbabwensis]|uniref:PiggyBac transposable element-derived protein 3 n=1 Tax=Trichinella zimbabwensis TaxID=268475 RepID=A0A0V1H4A5_9BILA|nr:PiggyBac transposable element-derived protein 3 [Trichinella zimbabwensis]